MEYTCSICQEKVVGDVVTLQEHTDVHIMDAIKEKHPEWTEKDGLCQKCIDYYKAQLKGES